MDMDMGMDMDMDMDTLSETPWIRWNRFASFDLPKASAGDVSFRYEDLDTNAGVLHFHALKKA